MRENSGRLGAKPGGRDGLTPGLHAVYAHLELAPGDPRKLPVRNAGSWAAELIDGRLPTVRPTAPPGLAPGLAMRSSANDVVTGSQMGLAVSIPESGEPETPQSLCPPFPVPGDPPGPPWRCVPTGNSRNTLITGPACKVTAPLLDGHSERKGWTTGERKNKCLGHGVG